MSLKRPGCFSPPKPLIKVFCFSMIFHPTSPLSIQFKKNRKDLVWNVTVLHSRQILSQALYSSMGIAWSSANFRAMNTNIYTSYHCSFPLYGHHSPTHFPSLVFFEPGIHAQSGFLGYNGSTMHKAFFPHLKFSGQADDSDKTKDIKMMLFHTMMIYTSS